MVNYHFKYNVITDAVAGSVLGMQRLISYDIFSPRRHREQIIERETTGMHH